MNEFRKHKASIGCDNAHLVELGRKNDAKRLESCFNKNTLIAVSLVANNKEIQTLVSDPRIEKLITVYQSLSEFKKTFSPISGLTAIANMLDLEKNNPGFVNNLSAQLLSQGCGASNLANSILTEALSLNKFSACLDSGTLIGVNLVSDMIE
jgi:hypothetical protein